MSDAQWTDRCPHCGTRGLLSVISVVLVATGKKTYPHSPLTPDGFVVDPKGIHEHLKDQSTTDEKVRCEACGKRFDLGDLSLDELLPPRMPGMEPTVRAFWQDRRDTAVGGRGMCVNVSADAIGGGFSNRRFTPQQAEALYEALGKVLSER